MVTLKDYPDIPNFCENLDLENQTWFFTALMLIHCYMTEFNVVLTKYILQEVSANMMYFFVVD